VSKRDIGASVRQRLLNQAHEQGRPFQELLQYFVMERFLYRLSKSQFRDSFILKGALLLTAWRAPRTRPTMDIDLMGRTDNGLKHIRSVVEEICGLTVEQDGVEFRKETIEIQRIKEDAEYANLDGVIRIVRGFAGPVLTAAVTEDGFQSHWRPGGPWVT
jgi:predicted nucleotidyltransferase component of viral defense system